MICESHNQPYSFVFATTAALWGNYATIQKWCWEARLARLTQNEYKDHIARYTCFHDFVRAYYELRKNISNQSYDVAKSNARQDTIRHMPDELKYNHKSESARSVELQPENTDGAAMQQRSRCFKCQGLYRWFVANETPYFMDWKFDPGSCAEDICNFFCRRVLPAPNPTLIADNVPAAAAAAVPFAAAQGALPAQTVTASYWPPNLNEQRPWNLLQNRMPMTPVQWNAV